MGCDIHAMIEKKVDGWWRNAGDPDIGRDYTIFAILADVRNTDNIPFISRPRGVPNDACPEFDAYAEGWESDGHSASWLSLKELKDYDIHQKYFSSALILGRDENGKITATCRGTSGSHMGVVGDVEIFGVFGSGGWERLIKTMEAVSNGDDESVRLVFFFDN